jgi:hypothetical protein
MSESYSDVRRAVREVYDQQRQIESFWEAIYRDYPIIRGHKELAHKVLRDNQAKMADMSIDAAREHLGELVVKEIDRRKRRDDREAEARVYGPGPMGYGGHGVTMDGRTVDIDPDQEREPRTFSDIIRERREARRSASRKYYDAPKDESGKRKRGAYAR